jgi:transforming growth factor-beta-induced protein
MSIRRRYTGRRGARAPFLAPLRTPLALVLAGGILAGCNDSDPVSAEPDPQPTIAQIVLESPAFSTLAFALDAAGLVAPLDDASAEFTVFAPTNDAFGPLNVNLLAGDADALTDVLLYHVVPTGALASSQLQDGQTLTTLAGESLLVRVVGGEVYIDGARVVTADVEAENGIVHVIDRTLTGSLNLAQSALVLNETNLLFETVVAAGLGDAFVSADGWTVFAPDNGAFEAAAEVAAGLSTEELQAVLQYHVVPSGVVDSGTLLGLLADNGGTIEVPTAQGESITITQVDATTITLNGGQATLDLGALDFFASNGILHLMDGVILPPSFTGGEE